VELSQDRAVAQVITRLKAADVGRVLAAGTWGSFAHLLTAYISGELQRPVLLICPHINDAEAAVDDLHTFGAQSVQLLPAWEGAEELADATDEIRSERAAVSLKVSQNNEKFLTVASIQALCQPTPKPARLQDSSLALAVNQELSPEVVTEWLVKNSFERTDRVDLPGQFARRGGIIDIYAPLCIGKASSDNTQTESSSQPSQALRIEFFGDTIESIRCIDLDTNRSTGRIDKISIVSAISGTDDDADELFLNILPQDCVIILEEPVDCEEIAKVFKQRLDDSARLFDWSQIHQALNRFKQLHISRFATSTDNEVINLGVKSIQQFQHTAASSWTGHKEALTELVEKAKTDNTVYFYCEAAAEIKRLTEIITDEHKKVPANFKLLRGFVHQGFCIDSLKTIAIGHQELFGQLMLRRKPRAARAAAPVDTLSDLQVGELVVHASYGIGKYLGIRTIEEKGGTSEYLTIEYADGVKIQVSASNIALVQ